MFDLKFPKAQVLVFCPHLPLGFHLKEGPFLCILFAQCLDIWLGAPCCTNRLSFKSETSLKMVYYAVFQSNQVYICQEFGHGSKFMKD